MGNRISLTPSAYTLLPRSGHAFLWTASTDPSVKESATQEGLLLTRLLPSHDYLSRGGVVLSLPLLLLFVRSASEPLAAWSYSRTHPARRAGKGVVAVSSAESNLQFETILVMQADLGDGSRSVKILQGEPLSRRSIDVDLKIGVLPLPQGDECSGDFFRSAKIR